MIQRNGKWIFAKVKIILPWLVLDILVKKKQTSKKTSRNMLTEDNARRKLLRRLQDWDGVRNMRWW